MKILLIDDHRLVAEAMARSLEELADNVEVSICHSTQRAFTLLDEGQHFDLVVTDLIMKGIDGLGLLQGLRNRKLSIPTVVVSSVEEDSTIKQAMDLGAAAFVGKTRPTLEMLRAIRRVLAGEVLYPEWYQPDDSANNGPATNNMELGEERYQVLKQVCRGKTNKEIAHLTATTENNIKYHMRKLFDQFGVSNRTTLIVKAIDLGLVPKSDDDSE